MSGAPAIVLSPRERWLLRRREFLTASDCAAVLGADPRRGPLAVYASKISDVVEPEERRWMAFGRRVEGAIADWYADETGRPARDLGAYEIQVHPDLPWLGATLDRQTAGSDAHPAPVPLIHPAPLEAKAVAGFKAAEWRDDPPLHFVVQLQLQMACTAAQWGSLVALIGGISLEWKDVLRDDGFLAAALPQLEAFWLRVKRRDPPEADGKPGTTEAIRRLWANEDGETVPLQAEALKLVEAWETTAVTKAATELVEQALENQLRRRLGYATFGALPDGTFLTLRTTKRAGYKVEPTEYRVLRRFRPRIRRRG